MVLAKEGLFFINIKEIKRPGNAPSQFQFLFNNEEKYFAGYDVKGAFEYAPNQIVAIVGNLSCIRFIDRTYEREVEEYRIPNISKEFLSLQPFPNYNYDNFPYVLIKDSKGLTVVNVRTKQSRVICKDSPFSFSSIERTSLLDFDATGEFLYHVELESIPVPNSKSRRENTSYIKKLKIDVARLDSCFK